MCQPYIESATSLSDEKFAKNYGLSWSPKTDFCYETKARKVMADFNFDALYR